MAEVSVLDTNVAVLEGEIPYISGMDSKILIRVDSLLLNKLKLSLCSRLLMDILQVNCLVFFPSNTWMQVK